MSKIPGFILKRLYVKGSLRHTPAGCQFVLRNDVGPGTIIGVRACEVDGAAYPVAALTLLDSAGRPYPAAAITPAAPLQVLPEISFTVRLAGALLQPGKHTLRVRLATQEMGEIDIPVTDVVRPAEPEIASVAPLLRNDGRGRPIKVAILGAGSAVFARQLMTDLLCTPGLDEGTFALVDIDARRLELAQAMGEKLVDLRGDGRWRVEATADRRQALPGCDYVINTIEVAGLRNVRPDYDIPLKYGVDQCIGDTIGPGGIFKMLRTGPTWLEIVRDVERLCPNAVVMNYTNPMSALTLLALRATRLQVVGLCHSVQSTSRHLAQYLDVPYEDLRWRCGGINHLAWFTELTYQGEDMYPRLRQAARNPEIYEADPVRFEVMLHLGAFVTESSGHFSEYVSYFRKRPDLVKRYTRPGYLGESGFYANNWPRWRDAADEAIRAAVAGETEVALKRGKEYASIIVEAVESGRPAVVHGNVLNDGLIDNLPAGGCVEVATLVDGTGLHPVRFGPLPPQLAAIDAAHMYVHELLVEAVLEQSRQAALHALMLDPLTAAVCSPDEIRSMFDEMWEAERADLATFD
jgi:alpha-galactosidase